MIFTSLEFAIFLFVLLVPYWALESKTKIRKALLLCSGLFFYSSANILYLLPLLVVAISNYLFALWIADVQSTSYKRSLLWIDVAISIGQLAIFKYLDFLFRSLESLLLLFNIQAALPALQIGLPVGISFFTFQALSYTIDVYRDPRQVVRSFPDVFLFVSFFPTILSGPIMRARDFIPQLNFTNRSGHKFREGYALILSGLFKKIVISSYLSEHVVRNVFQVPADYSAMAVLAAIYSYSVQIYCDFSGYSDLAIGIAILLGFKLPENFRSPYMALSLTEFWHKWHITLSTWLRDYLYIPLGGNRKGTLRKYLNLMITMLLGGLWHGADSKFLLWGGLHGLGLVVTHIFNDTWARLRPGDTKPGGSLIIRTLLWFITFNLVSFLWVFFRAEDSARAFEIFGAAFSFWKPGKGIEFMVVLAILTGLWIQLFGQYIHDFYLKAQERLPVPFQAVVITLITIMIIKLGPPGVPAFIYFSF